MYCGSGQAYVTLTRSSYRCLMPKQPALLVALLLFIVMEDVLAWLGYYVDIVLPWLRYYAPFVAPIALLVALASLRISRASFQISQASFLRSGVRLESRIVIPGDWTDSRDDVLIKVELVTGYVAIEITDVMIASLTGRHYRPMVYFESVTELKSGAQLLIILPEHSSKTLVLNFTRAMAPTLPGERMPPVFNRPRFEQGRVDLSINEPLEGYALGMILGNTKVAFSQSRQFRGVVARHIRTKGYYSVPPKRWAVSLYALYDFIYYA